MILFKHRRSAERDAFSVPRSVQKSIPIKRIYQDGVFQVSGKFSKTWRFFDVNYAVASPEKQRELFMTYCSFLNSLPIGATAKITLFNRQLNQKDFGRTLLMPMQGDRRDLYRNEYNALVLGKAAESNNLIQEKYITVSAEKKSVEEARAFFSRVGTDLTTGLSRMSSSVREITVNDRLRLLHDFYRPGEEQLFRFDLEDTMQRGHDFRDCIAPDCISFQKNHYELGDHVGRTLFLREYASFISDEMITELMDYPRNMMLSIDIIPVAMDEAVSDIRKRIMSVESDITRWQQRQNQSNNFTANIPYDLEQMRSETKEFMDDLMSRDQRMMLALVTLTHLADNLEQLDQDTEALQAIGRARGCQFNILRYQQEDALNTVLPLGLKRIDATRTLTTECTAVLMPFKSQEIQDAGGIYYGVNAVSHNLIICNRGNLLNGNGFITGVSGSGKSMAAKQEMTALALSTDHDIIIVDPEREYGELVRALGGLVWCIDFGAMDPGLQPAMRRLLADCGIHEGVLLTKPLLQTAQAQALRRSEVFGWVSLNFTGGCLAIESTPSQTQTVREPPPRQGLYASADGEILAVEIESGFAAVTVGQTVARGQLLAAAERLDRKGNAVPQGADGRVIARVQKHYTARQSLTAEAPVYTGRSSVQTTLYLPWRSYTDEPEDPLTGITQTDWLPVQLGRLALPASLCRVTTWEQLPDTVQYSEAAAAALALRACRAALLAEFPDAVIEAEQREISAQEGTETAAVTYIFTANIAAPP